MDRDKYVGVTYGNKERHEQPRDGLVAGQRGWTSSGPIVRKSRTSVFRCDGDVDVSSRSPRELGLNKTEIKTLRTLVVGGGRLVLARFFFFGIFHATEYQCCRISRDLMVGRWRGWGRKTQNVEGTLQPMTFQRFCNVTRFRILTLKKYPQSFSKVLLMAGSVFWGDLRVQEIKEIRNGGFCGEFEDYENLEYFLRILRMTIILENNSSSKSFFSF